jgi:IclR helix-turn-helix domain
MPLNSTGLKQRNDMWVALFQIIESLRDDYLPGEPFYAAFTKIVIVHSMFHPYLRYGRASSVTEISRRTGIPRQTVVRKLAELAEQSLVEARGRSYVPAASFFNQPGSTRKFEKRRAMLKRALGIA